MSYIGEGEKLKIEHIRRPPLPWREAAVTECGLPAEGHPVITRDDFIAKVDVQGQQRALLTTCQTCFDTAIRHPSWINDPVQCIYREVTGARRDSGVFKRELLALAALVSRHPAEFQELLDDQQQIVALRDAARRPRKGARRSK